MVEDGCAICAGPAGDAELDRVEVWRDDLWRLSMSTEGYTLGFSYLEPLRHVPHIEDLDGPEAAAFGSTIARICRALREAAGAERIFVYVFGGGIPHLHVHLGPHVAGDALNTAIIRGEVAEEKLPSGATRMTSLEFTELPRAEIAGMIERTTRLLGGTTRQLGGTTRQL
jgi:diadenosine tetraphosphate (Ap4A) HIT family hydrolase